VPSAVELLRSAWNASCERLRAATATLTDDEFFWEPCAGCWTVRLDPERLGGWFMDYPHPPPEPPPVTTIAWRLLHIAHGNWIYWEHAFGPGRRTFLDLPTMHTAAAAVADLVASQEPVTATLAAIDDAGLDAPARRLLGDPWPAHRILTTLLDEQVHHGAEISLLRDLFRNR
jgi:hypothetical protein